MPQFFVQNWGLFWGSLSGTTKNTPCEPVLVPTNGCEYKYDAYDAYDDYDDYDDDDDDYDDDD